MDISTINHSEIGVTGTNLAKDGAPPWIVDVQVAVAYGVTWLLQLGFFWAHPNMEAVEYHIIPW